MHRKRNRQSLPSFQKLKKSWEDQQQSVSFPNYMRDTHFTTVRQALRIELESRSKRNSRYTLRMFARHLGISPTSLSDVLNEKRKLSPRMGERISHRLQLNEQLRVRFINLVNLEQNRSRESKLRARLRLRRKSLSEIEQITEAQINQCSTWLHLSILEYIYLNPGEQNSDALAKIMRVEASDVNRAISHLKASGLLRFQDSNPNDLTSNHELLTSTAGTPSLAIQRFHRSLLEKISQDIPRIGPDRRLNEAGIFSLSENDFSKIKEIVKNTYEEIIEVINSSEQANNIYAISLNLMPIQVEST